MAGSRLDRQQAFIASAPLGTWHAQRGLRSSRRPATAARRRRAVVSLLDGPGPPAGADAGASGGRQHFPSEAEAALALPAPASRAPGEVFSGGGTADDEGAPGARASTAADGAGDSAPDGAPAQPVRPGVAADDAAAEAAGAAADAAPAAVLDLGDLDTVGREMMAVDGYARVATVDVDAGGALLEDADNNDLLSGVGFDTMLDDRRLVKTLDKAFGYRTMTHVQLAAIPLISDGSDIVIQSYTGTGKTLAFLLPLLERMDEERAAVQSVIVAPTRELAMQIFREFERLAANTDFRAMALIGGANPVRQVDKLREKTPHVVVGTPGRLAELSHNRALKLGKVETVVIDEIDQCMEDSFREHMEYVMNACPKGRQLVFASATGDNDAVRGYAQEWMHKPELLRVTGERTIPGNIKHWCTIVPARLRIDIVRRLMTAKDRPTSAICFVDDPRRVDIVCQRLFEMNLSAGALRGNAHKLERAEMIRLFRKGQVPLLVTTEVAARGLDVPEVTHVFNLDLPTDADHYVHRAGRCGRAGAPGTVVNIATAENAFVIGRLGKELNLDITRMEPRGGVYAPPLERKRNELLGDRRQKGRESKDAASSRRVQLSDSSRQASSRDVRRGNDNERQRGARRESFTQRSGRPEQHAAADESFYRRRDDGASSGNRERSESYSRQGSERNGRESFGGARSFSESRSDKRAASFNGRGSRSYEASDDARMRPESNGRGESGRSGKERGSAPRSVSEGKFNKRSSSFDGHVGSRDMQETRDVTRQGYEGMSQQRRREGGYSQGGQTHERERSYGNRSYSEQGGQSSNRSDRVAYGRSVGERRYPDIANGSRSWNERPYGRGSHGSAGPDGTFAERKNRFRRGPEGDSTRGWDRRPQFEERGGRDYGRSGGARSPTRFQDRSVSGLADNMTSLASPERGGFQDRRDGDGRRRDRQRDGDYRERDREDAGPFGRSDSRSRSRRNDFRDRRSGERGGMPSGAERRMQNKEMKMARLERREFKPRGEQAGEREERYQSDESVDFEPADVASQRKRRPRPKRPTASERAKSQRWVGNRN